MCNIYTLALIQPSRFTWALKHSCLCNTSCVESSALSLEFRGQELCESRGGRHGLPVTDSPYGLRERKATLNKMNTVNVSNRLTTLSVWCLYLSLSPSPFYLCLSVCPCLSVCLSVSLSVSPPFLSPSDTLLAVSMIYYYYSDNHENDDGDDDDYDDDGDAGGGGGDDDGGGGGDDDDGGGGSGGGGDDDNAVYNDADSRD